MNRTAHLSGSRSEGGLSRSACQQPRGSANLQVVAVPRHRLPELMVMIWVAGRRLRRWKVGVLPDLERHVMPAQTATSLPPFPSAPAATMSRRSVSPASSWRRPAPADVAVVTTGRAADASTAQARPPPAGRAPAAQLVPLRPLALVTILGPPHVGDDRRIVVVRLVSPQSPVPRTVL
jgi:hypothetical protein